MAAQRLVSIPGQLMAAGPSPRRSMAAESRGWRTCFMVSAMAVLLTFWPDGLLQFRYERAALSSGRWWLLLSAHLVHLNSIHLLLNLAGLWLIRELSSHDLPSRHVTGLLLTSALSIDALLWLLHPEIAWYAGLSGAVHGLWAGCALGLLWPAQERADCSGRVHGRFAGLAALLVLGAKLWLETGSQGLTAQIIDAPVIDIAHLYGAMAGISYVIAWRTGQLLLRVK